MKTAVNLRALKINGHDPRLSKSFLLLSRELNHLNGSLPSKLDWYSLEDQCFQLFREYGYDLQSGVWFCLISLRLKSWKGLALALDLLSTAFIHNNQRCWPPVAAVQQRQYLVDWFSANVATHIYTLTYGLENVGDMQRVERSINVLFGQSKNLQTRSQDSLKNLHYFLQVRCRSVPYPQQVKVEKIMPLMVEAPASIPVKEVAESSELEAAEIPEISLAPPPQSRPLLWALSGMIGGGMIVTMAVSLWTSVHAPTLSESVIAPLVELQQTQQRLDTAWLRVPEVDIKAQQTDILQGAAGVFAWANTQPSFALFNSMGYLSNRLELSYPGNTVSAEWRRRLKDKSESIAFLDGFINANLRLDQLDARLLNAEQTRSKYMTVSELKTAINQIRQDLIRGGIPTEALLWEIKQLQKNNKRVNPALLEQVSKRLEALNATYWLVNEDL